MNEIEKMSRSRKHDSSQRTGSNRKLKKNGKPKMAFWKKLWLTLTLAILLFLGAVFAYSTIVLNRTEDVFKSTFSDLGLKSSKKSDDIIKATEPLTILLMGVDTGGEGRSDPWAGQSDTMIVMTLNPKTHTTTMVSL